MDSNFLDPQRPSAGPGRTSGSAGKRGRKQILPDPGDGPVAQFARQLSELKRAAGDPSYDRMRSRLGAVASKSALSAAARGQNLPSWETTWEFVRSLAVAGLSQDQEATYRTWRYRWEQASEAQLAANPSPDAPSGQDLGGQDLGGTTEATHTDPGPSTEPADSGTGSEPGTAPGTITTPESVTEPSTRKHRNHLQAGAFAVLVAVLGTFLVILVVSRNDPATNATTTPASPSNPPTGKLPSRYPIPGDSAYPGSRPDGADLDVTYPDGSVVRVDQPFDKVWRLRNTGTVVWENRFLQAFGDTTDMCESPERVLIPRTEPGQLVEITLPVVAKHEGVCHVPWKMVDARGELVFPTELRPIRYQVRVVR